MNSHAAPKIGMLRPALLACIGLYIFLLPWTDAFRLTGILPIYMLPLMSTAALFSAHLAIYNKNSLSELVIFSDTFIFLILIYFASSAIIFWNPKSINYASAYFFAILAMYKLISMAIFRLNISDFTLRANDLAVVFVSLYCIIEFVGKNYFGVSPNDIVPRTREATATIAGLTRVYGLATEPAVTAYYLNCLGPLAIWHLYSQLWKPDAVRKSAFIAITAIAIVAQFLTFSVTGYLAFAAVSIVSLVGVWYRNPKFIKSAIGIAVASAALAIALLGPRLMEVSSVISDKMTLNSDYKSVSQRIDAWTESVLIARTTPIFGSGLGSISAQQGGSPLNWYLSLFQETGAVGVFLWIAIVLKKLREGAMLTSTVGWPLVAGLLAASIHLFTISTFYNPFIWMILAMIDYFYVVHLRRGYTG